MQAFQLCRKRGVTLFETMITLAIVSIIVMSVAPSVQAIILQQRVVATLNAISTALRIARFYAIDHQTTTTVCASMDFINCRFDRWSRAKIVFVDANNNDLRDIDEPILFSTETAHHSLTIQGPRRLIHFYGNGMVASPATLLICPQPRQARFNRGLILSLQGRVRLSKDYNDDGIHEVRKGKPVHCE